MLEREVPGTSHHDAMGPYPLFVCQDWSKLEEDLEDLQKDLVSLTVVTDSFGDYDENLLHRCFPDKMIPFKEHFVTDPASPSISKHHRYYTRKAQEKVHVEECPEPLQFLDEWVNLYAELAQRHGLAGIQAFSRESFAQQLKVPGLVMLRAVSEGEVVGMHLWYASGEVGYSHLAASSERGYELMASYALHGAAIERFAGKLRWLDFGGGAGVGESASGLSRFKKGWATGSRIAYLCGRVLDPKSHARLSGRLGNPITDYFPAYRTGEFG